MAASEGTATFEFSTNISQVASEIEAELQRLNRAFSQGAGRGGKSNPFSGMATDATRQLNEVAGAAEQLERRISQLSAAHGAKPGVPNLKPAIQEFEKALNQQGGATTPAQAVSAALKSRLGSIDTATARAMTEARSSGMSEQQIERGVRGVFEPLQRVQNYTAQFLDRLRDITPTDSKIGREVNLGRVGAALQEVARDPATYAPRPTQKVTPAPPVPVAEPAPRTPPAKRVPAPPAPPTPPPAPAGGGSVSLGYRGVKSTLQFDPQGFYRGIGEAGYRDFLQTGVIRSKDLEKYPNPYFSQGAPLDRYDRGSGDRYVAQAHGPDIQPTPNGFHEAIGGAIPSSRVAIYRINRQTGEHELVHAPTEPVDFTTFPGPRQAAAAGATPPPPPPPTKPPTPAAAEPPEEPVRKAREEIAASDRQAAVAAKEDAQQRVRGAQSSRHRADDAEDAERAAKEHGARLLAGLESGEYRRTTPTSPTIFRTDNPFEVHQQTGRDSAREVESGTLEYNKMLGEVGVALTNEKQAFARGSESADKLVREMDAMAKQVAATAEVMSGLGRVYEKIGRGFVADNLGQGEYFKSTGNGKYRPVEDHAERLDAMSQHQEYLQGQGRQAAAANVAGYAEQQKREDQAAQDARNKRLADARNNNSVDRVGSSSFYKYDNGDVVKRIGKNVSTVERNTNEWADYTAANAKAAKDAAEAQKREEASQKRTQDAARNKVLSSDQIGGGFGGLVNSFAGGLTSRGFGSGGGGINLNGLAASAGNTVKYTALYRAIGLVTEGISQLGAQYLNFVDSNTELDVALTSSAANFTDFNHTVEREIAPSTGMINQLADAAVVAGANVGDAMDVAASGIRAFGKEAEGAQGGAEAIGVQFNKFASQAAVLGKTTVADAAGNLKAIAAGFALPTGSGDELALSLQRVNDAVAGAKAVGGGDEKQLFQGIASIAGIAHSAGAPLNDLAVVISRVQAQTDEAGSAIAQRISRVFSIVGGSEGAGAIGKLNQSLSKQYQIDPNGSTWDQLRQIAKAYGEIKKEGGDTSQILSKFGGTSNTKELQAAFDAINQLLPETKNGFNFAGAAGREFQKRMGDLTKVLQRLKGELSGIAVNAGLSGAFDVLVVGLKALEPVLDTVRRMLQLFNDIPHPIRTAGFAVLELVGAMKLLQAVTRAGGFGAALNATAARVAPGRTLAQQQLAAIKAEEHAKSAAAPPRGIATPAMAAAAAGGARVGKRYSQLEEVDKKSGEETTKAADRLNRARAKAAKITDTSSAEFAAADQKAVAAENRYNAVVAKWTARREAAEAKLTAALEESARLNRAVAPPALAPGLARQMMSGALPIGGGYSRYRNAFRSGRLPSQLLDDEGGIIASSRGGLRGGLRGLSQQGAMDFQTRVLPALSRGVNAVESTFRSLGTQAKALGRQFGAIGLAFAGFEVVSGLWRAGKGLNDADRQTSTLLSSNAGTYQNASDLREQGQRARAQAEADRAASGGLFGTIQNYLRGDETGQNAKDLIAQAKADETAATALEDLQKKAEQAKDAVGSIDISSVASIDASFQQLTESGRDGIAQFNALQAAIESLGAAAGNTAGKLDPLTKAQFGQNAIANIVKGIPGLADQNEASGDPSMGVTRNALRKVVELVPGVRHFSPSQGESQADQLRKINLEKLQESLTEDYKTFTATGGDPMSEAGKKALGDMWRTSIETMLSADNVHLSDANRKALEEQLVTLGLGTATSGVKGKAAGADKATDPHDKVADLLSKAADAASARAETKSYQDVLGAKPTAQGQLEGLDLTGARAKLEGLETTRKNMEATGVANARDLERINQQILEAQNDVANKYVAYLQSLADLAVSGVSRFDAGGRIQAQIDALRKELQTKDLDPTVKRQLQSQINDLIGQAADQVAADAASAAQAVLDPRDSLGGDRTALATANRHIRDIEATGVFTGQAHDDAVTAAKGAADKLAQDSATEAKNLNTANVAIGDHVGEAYARYSNALIDAARAFNASDKATAAKDAAQALLDAATAHADDLYAGRQARTDPLSSIANDRIGLQHLQDQRAGIARTDQRGLDENTRAQAEARAQLRRDQVAQANAHTQSGVRAGDDLGGARANLVITRRTLNSLKRGEDGYWEALKAYHDAQKAYAQAQVQHAYNRRVAGIDPRDQISLAQAQLDEDRRMLRTMHRGDDDYLQQQAKIRQDQQSLNDLRAQRAEAIARAGADPGSPLQQARAELKAAQIALNNDEKGSAQWYQDYATLKSAQRTVAQAELDYTNTLEQLSGDITDPVAQAKAKLDDTNRRLARASSPDERASLRLQQREDAAGLEEAQFQQRLSTEQTAYELHRQNAQQYMAYLKSEHNRLSAIAKRTYQEQQELDTIDRAIKDFNSSMDAQFNLGDIKLPTVYEVRRYMGAATAASATQMLINQGGQALNVGITGEATVNANTTGLSTSTATAASAADTLQSSLSSTETQFNGLATSTGALNAAFQALAAQLANGATKPTTPTAATPTTPSTNNAALVKLAAQVAADRRALSQTKPGTTDYQYQLARYQLDQKRYEQASSSTAKTDLAAAVAPAAAAASAVSPASTTTVYINGADFAKVVDYLNKVLGQSATRTRGLSSRKA